MPRARKYRTPERLPTLEARRDEARALAASGLSGREIADLLGYTRRTVRRYLEPDPPEPWSAFGPAEPG